MKKKIKLSRREREIAEMLAWGATKKEISGQLFIADKTVDNHTSNIYQKTGCNKATELSAWWFCNEYHIPVTLSPRVKKLLATFLLIFYLGSVTGISGHLRPRTDQQRHTARVTRVIRSREYELQIS